MRGKLCVHAMWGTLKLTIIDECINILTHPCALYQYVAAGYNRANHCAQLGLCHRATIYITNINTSKCVHCMQSKPKSNI